MKQALRGKKTMRVEIEWWAQPRQLAFLQACGLSHPFDGSEPRSAAAKIIGYGGAAGGGKSDSLMGLAIIAAWTIPGVQIAYFRREFPQLEGLGGAILRSHNLIDKRAVKWNGTQRRWTFPNRAAMQFCHCKSEEDVHNYQSNQFDIILLDEGTQFTRFIYRYLLTRNRANTDTSWFKPFMAIATNPGGVGHSWFKNEFVTIGVPEQVYDVEVEPGRNERHMFIPAKLSDNQILCKRDPGYRENLENQPEATRSMLLDGNFNVFAGQVFEEFRNNPEHYIDRRWTHVIEPFKIPEEGRRYRTFDFGYARPFSVGWWWVDYDGRLYRYRELYGCTGDPDKGIKWHPKQIAQRIREIENEFEKGHQITGIADPSIWTADTGASVAEQMAQEGVYFDPADNKRIPGKMQVHYRLAFDEEGLPMMYVFNTCRAFIRTMPILIYDEHHPEDVDTKQEDHIYDETRYLCQANPIPPRKNVPIKIKPYNPFEEQPARNPYGFMQL
jgi:hypothetical protein